MLALVKSFCVIVNLFSAYSDPVPKCELSSWYLTYSVNEDSFKGDKVLSKVKGKSLCGAFAYRESYAAFGYSSEQATCTLGSVNRTSIDVTSNDGDKEVSIDSGLIQSPLKLQEFVYLLDTIESFTLDYGNVLAQSPLVGKIDAFKPDIGEALGNKAAVFHYNGDFYLCSGLFTQPCLSYDLIDYNETVNPSRQPLADIHAKYLGVGGEWVQLNGKVWFSGGRNMPAAGNPSHKRTAFLHPDKTWTTGPELPAAKSNHAVVALDETTALVFGGILYPGNDAFSHPDVAVQNLLHDRELPYLFTSLSIVHQISTNLVCQLPAN